MWLQKTKGKNAVECSFSHLLYLHGKHERSWFPLVLIWYLICTPFLPRFFSLRSQQLGFVFQGYIPHVFKSPLFFTNLTSGLLPSLFPLARSYPFNEIIDIVSISNVIIFSCFSDMIASGRLQRLFDIDPISWKLDMIIPHYTPFYFPREAFTNRSQIIVLIIFWIVFVPQTFLKVETLLFFHPNWKPFNKNKGGLQN